MMRMMLDVEIKGEEGIVYLYLRNRTMEEA
jgi:hypothetical protein